MKILHIEDTQTIIDAFSKVLTRKGHDFSSCNNGKKGLELILNNYYDLIFLDLTMPDFSGFDLLNELEKDGRHKDKNIVVVTATSLSTEGIDELYKKGVKGVLQKPVSLKDLMNEIKQTELTVI